MQKRPWVTPDIVEEIVEQINSYAEETMGADAYGLGRLLHVKTFEHLWASTF